MTYLVQDSTQQRVIDSLRADSVRAESLAVAATMTAPPPTMPNPRSNQGYLVAVYVECVLLFGGYWLLLYRRNASLRARQKHVRTGR